VHENKCFDLLIIKIKDNAFSEIFVLFFAEGIFSIMFHAGIIW